MRKVWTFLAAVLLTVGDQLLKLQVVRTLGTGRVIRFGNFIALRYVENAGAAFSMLSGKTLILTVGTGLLILGGFIALFSGRVRSKLLYVSLTMVLSGGVANLIDRVRLHYVVDYIEPLFVNFAVFNFADCLITVGAAMMILWLILDTIREKKTAKGAQREGSDE